MAAWHAPAAQAHAEDVELLRSAAERLATALGSGARPQLAGGHKAKAALSPGGHISRGTGDAGDAAVSGRDKRSEDLRGNFGNVSEDLRFGVFVRGVWKCLFLLLGDMLLVDWLE